MTLFIQYTPIYHLYPAHPPQVISDYCKTHHQVKPFSHIVMDLFHDAVNQPEEEQEVEVVMKTRSTSVDKVHTATTTTAVNAAEEKQLLQKKRQQVDEK